MASIPRTYHALFVRWGDGVWRMEFGDYKLEVVLEERDDVYAHDHKKKDVKILQLEDTNEAIMTALAYLNRDTKA